MLNFLNDAKSAEEIAKAVEIAHERDVGMIVAQHILDRREQLGGFTNLQQVADIHHVGPERFTEIAITLRGERTEGSNMTYQYEDVTSYYIRFKSGSGATRAQIQLNYRRMAVIVDFLDENLVSSLRPPQFRKDGSVARMWYWFTSFPSIIDVLRNEKPIWLELNPASNYAAIATSAEPVGEEELAP